MVSAAPHPPYVLLADTDLQSQSQFREFFSKVGWRFDIATTNAELVNAAKKGEFDVIITDVSMGASDGIQLLANILDARPSQAIIAVSKDASLEEAIRYFRLGAADLLPRPVDFGWLERSVRQLVQGLRDDARGKRIYKFLKEQSSVFVMSSRELAEVGFVSLPIITSLQQSKILNDQTALRLRLAVQELVVNALEHGNLGLESEWKEELGENGIDKFTILRRERLQSAEYGDKPVRIEAHYEVGKLRISVRDVGPGFLNNVPANSQANGSTLRCYGRGLALISSAVDEIRFENNGAEVMLIKYLEQ